MDCLIGFVKSISGQNSKNGEIGSGTIVFDLDGAIQRIPYFIKDVPDLRNTPRFVHDPRTVDEMHIYLNNFITQKTQLSETHLLSIHNICFDVFLRNYTTFFSKNLA